MNDHVSVDRLNAFAAGELGGEVLHEVERHIAVCDTCRAESAALTAMLEELSALPRSIEPARDLRPDIWRAIDGVNDSRVLPFRQRSLASLRWPLAAAAIVLVAVTAVLTSALVRSRDDIGQPVIAQNAPAPGYVQAVAARYDEATGELELLVRERKDGVSPATLRVLEENLRVIDRALSESRAALERDPGNAAATRMLMATYAKKLDLLRTATQTMVGI